MSWHYIYFGKYVTFPHKMVIIFNDSNVLPVALSLSQSLTKERVPPWISTFLNIIKLSTSNIKDSQTFL